MCQSVTEHGQKCVKEGLETVSAGARGVARGHEGGGEREVSIEIDSQEGS